MLHSADGLSSRINVIFTFFLNRSQLFQPLTDVPWHHCVDCQVVNLLLWVFQLQLLPVVPSPLKNLPDTASHTCSSHQSNFEFLCPYSDFAGLVLYVGCPLNHVMLNVKGVRGVHKKPAPCALNSTSWKNYGHPTFYDHICFTLYFFNFCIFFTFDFFGTVFKFANFLLKGFLLTGQNWNFFGMFVFEPLPSLVIIE